MKTKLNWNNNKKDYIMEQVALNKSSLLLKIQKVKHVELQIFTKIIKTKIFTKTIKMPC